LERSVSQKQDIYISKLTKSNFNVPKETETIEKSMQFIPLQNEYVADLNNSILFTLFRRTPSIFASCDLF